MNPFKEWKKSKEIAKKYRNISDKVKTEESELIKIFLNGVHSGWEPENLPNDYREINYLDLRVMVDRASEILSDRKYDVLSAALYSIYDSCEVFSPFRRTSIFRINSEKSVKEIAKHADSLKALLVTAIINYSNGDSILVARYGIVTQDNVEDYYKNHLENIAEAKTNIEKIIHDSFQTKDI
jgi:hypothetical protein